MRNARTLVFATLAALAGCQAMEPKEAPPKPLVGTRWEVILELPLPGEQPWIRVGDGRLEGFGGCNRINARYVRDTVGARAIAVGRISTGMRACDPGVVAAEQNFIDVLQAVSSYSVTGDLMVLTGSAGSIRLRAVSDVLAAGVDITNSRWIASDAQVPGAGNTPRLEFSGDGRVSGYTGCNSLSGSFTLIGDLLELAAATTKRACAGPGGDYEKRLLEVLADKPRIKVSGGRMTITGARGGKLEFVAPSGAPAR
jgi:heat shock protein HslJ